MSIPNEDKLVQAIVRLFDGKNPLYLFTKVGGGNYGAFRRNFQRRQVAYEKSYLKILLPLFKSIAEEVKKHIKDHPENPKFWTFNVNRRKTQLKTLEKKMIEFVYPFEGQYGLDLVLREPGKFTKDAEVEMSFDITDVRAIEQAEKRTNKIASVVGNYDKDLRNAIGHGIEEGLSMPKIAESIVQYVEGKSVTTSLMVARTETIWASNASAEMGYLQSGVVEGKQWLGGQAGICPICEEMDGMTAPLGGSFDVSAIIDKYGINFDYTEGSMPFPPLHPNCRCTIVPIIKSI